ncbi:MAG: PDDEXK nuclease domain-containing protein, partial [Propionibacteriaceae bacterium]|nr:PDDEXK nuclease domain-containing protein [Propionibacteriaceae bacterium]
MQSYVDSVRLVEANQFFLTWPAEKIWRTSFAKSLPPDQSTVAGVESAPSVPTVSDLSVLAKVFPLPWSAYIRLMSVQSSAARDFYETEALRNGWTVRQLTRQINSMFYERIALSKNKAAMLTKGGEAEPGDVITPEEAIKDPFVLEFLDLKDEYSESELEDALITHLADFLRELGDDFAFLARQRRLRLDDRWFRVDLVFFHRTLRCLLLIDLKTGR